MIGDPSNFNVMKTSKRSGFSISLDLLEGLKKGLKIPICIEGDEYMMVSINEEETALIVTPWESTVEKKEKPPEWEKSTYNPNKGPYGAWAYKPWTWHGNHPTPGISEEDYTNQIKGSMEK